MSDKPLIVTVAPDALDVWWPMVWCHLGPACARSDVSGREILSKARRRFARVAVVLACDDNGPHSVGALAVERHEGNIHVTALGGERFTDWAPQLWNWLRELAARQGKREITLAGRPGWLRRLRPWSFELVEKQAANRWLLRASV